MSTETVTSTTTTSPSTSKRQKVSEFNDGRKTPSYPWLQSATDWFKQSLKPSYADEQVERRLLSYLPFFPESDGLRRASVINTDIGNGNYIHELFIENLEKDTSKDASSTKEIVLVHGYAASLGLFIDNFVHCREYQGSKFTQ